MKVLGSSVAIFFAICGLFAGETRPSGRAEHVVLIVWDGMRPDFITPERTPTLSQLAREGVFFKNHHSVYVTSTEVNGAALATGDYPDRTGIIANRDYRPELGWQDSLGTETVEAIRRGDLLTGGRFIAVPTVAEILHQSGYPTVIAGSKPVALLHDRSNRRRSAASLDSVVLYAGHTIPSTALAAVIEANGKEIPTNATPNTARDAWTTKGLTEVLWKNGLPKFTLLWLSEPDASQHASSPGSEKSRAALASSDRNLAAVLSALQQKNARDKTDVLVVSDHGFSTIQRVADVAELLKKAGFKAGKKLDDPEPGEVVVVGLGGTVMFYVIDHLPSVTRRLVEFLQGSDFAGVIFSRLALPGTFPLEQVRLNRANPAPDVIASMRWSDEKNQYGAPGLIVSEGGKKDEGTHSSLSRFDLHNTLVAAGPDFRAGYQDELPTGNADVAPTVLWILGVRAGPRMDGRVLTEALQGQKAPRAKLESKRVEASRDLPLGRWRQHLDFTRFGRQIYFEEGNGEWAKK